MTAFRTNVENAVTSAIHDLGREVQLLDPAREPADCSRTPAPCRTIRTRPPLRRISPTDQAKYTPVNDDQTGRTDQVSFGNRGIPSLGNIGVYDSSTDPAIGGNENPYPSGYPSKPGISFLYGQDTMSRQLPEPELLRRWRGSRSGRLRQAVGGPAARRRVRGHVLLVRGRVRRAGRQGREAEPSDRLLRAEPEEGDGDPHGHLRRRLQPRRQRRHQGSDVLLGLRRRQRPAEDQRTRPSRTRSRRRPAGTTSSCWSRRATGRSRRPTSAPTVRKSRSTSSRRTPRRRRPRASRSRPPAVRRPTRAVS